MPKRASRPVDNAVKKRLKQVKDDHAVSKRLKEIKEMVDATTTVAKGNVLAMTSANKKQPPTLKPPKPSQNNQFDTSARMLIECSASNYAVAWAAKGSPTSNEKPYTLPLEEGLTNENDLTLNAKLGCYSIVKRKDSGSLNSAKQFRWTTPRGAVHWTDWKVRNYQIVRFECAKKRGPTHLHFNVINQQVIKETSKYK